jgi:tRNA U34 5-carboxymethylaminomethyl modifying enzyme MnmG/GidA
MKSKLIKTAAVMLTTGTLLAGSLAVANTFVLKLGWNGEDTIKNAINYITSLTKTANQVDQLKAALRAQAEGNVALYKDLEKANYAAEDLKEVLPNPMPDGDGSDDL